MQGLGVLVEASRTRQKRWLVLMSIIFPNHWEPVTPNIDPDEWVEDDED